MDAEKADRALALVSVYDGISEILLWRAADGNAPRQAIAPKAGSRLTKAATPRFHRCSPRRDAFASRSHWLLCWFDLIDSIRLPFSFPLVKRPSHCPAGFSHRVLKYSHLPALVTPDLIFRNYSSTLRSVVGYNTPYGIRR